MPAARPIRRRAVVVGAGLAVALGAVSPTGCGIVRRVPEPPPRRDEDDALVRRARLAQERLLRLVVATAAAHPGLADTLAPLQEHHRTHVSVLGGSPDEVAPTTPPASEPATGTPTTTPTPTPTTPTTTPTESLGTPAVPSSPAAALAAVRAAEATASSERGADSVASASGDLARVLAAMAAGQAQHVVVLDAAARAGAGR